MCVLVDALSVSSSVDDLDDEHVRVTACEVDSVVPPTTVGVGDIGVTGLEIGESSADAAEVKEGRHLSFSGEVLEGGREVI